MNMRPKPSAYDKVLYFGGKRPPASRAEVLVDDDIAENRDLFHGLEQELRIFGERWTLFSPEAIRIGGEDAHNWELLRDMAETGYVEVAIRFKTAADGAQKMPANRRSNRPRPIDEAARRRRERKVANGGHHTRAEFAALKALLGNRCACCGEPETADAPLHADHIRPLYEGGCDDISNIQPLCNSCNSRKGTQTIDYRSVALGGAAK